MKKIHRFLVTALPTTDTLIVTDKTLVHLMTKVLKLSMGEQCSIFTTGSDDYLCCISDIKKHSVTLRKEKVIPKKIVPRELTSCISITKRDSFELIVQKLTELGVHTIIPVRSERTVKQELRLERLQKISDEALEQSGGSTRVVIHEPCSLQEALESQKGTTSCYFDIGALSYKKELPRTSMSFYIGPEGGWSDDDILLFAKHTVVAYTLGGTTLRAETAAIVGAYTLLWN